MSLSRMFCIAPPCSYDFFPDYCILKNAVVYYPMFETSGDVAQLGERSVRIREVESSILFVSTMTHTNSCIESYIMCELVGGSQLITDCFFVFPENSMLAKSM